YRTLAGIYTAKTARKSGKAYRQPVSYVRDGDVLLTPGGGRWTLNLAGGRPARIRLRGRDVPARPELVTDPAELERLLGVIAEQNPRAARFIPAPTGAWTPTSSTPRCGTASASCAGTSRSGGNARRAVGWHGRSRSDGVAYGCRSVPVSMRAWLLPLRAV
ncbi:MAG: hypothetical protein ACRDOL_42390, partial [Streptosporangiaceae bacterium]